jgi:hypothetical protein
VFDLRRIYELLGKLKGTGQDTVALSGFGNEVLTQLVQQAETMVCHLENIDRQTCLTLNEAHTQTGLQAEIRDAIEGLHELYRAEHATAALALDRLKSLRQELEECCPPPEPEPFCKPVSCAPPAEPGEGESTPGSADPQEVSGAPYPPFEIEGEPRERRNEDVMPEVPVGPLRGSYNPSLPLAQLFELQANGADAQALGGAGDQVIFQTDNPFGTRVSFSGVPPDMSGAMHDRLVLESGNTFAALSTDAGATFNALNPTAIFPSAATKDATGKLLDNGLCCDQVIQYSPQIDRFLWLMQFCGTGPGGCLNGINKIRLASASSQDIISSNGTAWTYWDLTSGTFNLGNTTMDYPDMSVGTNSLYISADAVGVGLLVVRIPLDQIKAGGTINFQYTNPKDSQVAYGGHITQNTGDEVYWAGHNNTSQMRVFSWKEGENRYYWRDINIKSWPNSDFTSSCPDGTDWLAFGFPRSAVIGATRRDTVLGLGGGRIKELWFAWSAGRGGGWAHPHIPVVQINADDWTVVKQWEIWNPDFAFAYPCLATNSNEEVGISLGWGGNKTTYASHAVGILGDFIVWYPEASDAAINRWGDYVTVRRASPKDCLYAGVGYAVRKNTPPATGTRFSPHYILFGRESCVSPPPPPPIG